VPPVRIVEVIAGKVGCELSQHLNEPSFIQMILDLIEREVGEAVSVECSIEDEIDDVEDQRSLDPSPDIAATMFQTPAIQCAGGREKERMQKALEQEPFPRTIMPRSRRWPAW
jgi:hypothetical protein